MRLTRNIDESFAAHNYPTTTAELIEQHGETELKLPNGAVTLGAVLSRLPNEELETEEDARFTTYSMLGEEAIGRKGYSDRDPSCPGEEGHERVSL